MLFGIIGFIILLVVLIKAPGWILDLICWQIAWGLCFALISDFDAQTFWVFLGQPSAILLSIGTYRHRRALKKEKEQEAFARAVKHG